MPQRTPHLLVLVLAVTFLICGFGCITVVSHESHRTLKTAGKPISDEVLGQIQPGVTTKEWVLAALGAPTNEVKLNDGVEILEYEYGRETRTSFEFLFLIDSETSKETREEVHLELKDGIVQRYWRDD